MRQVVATLREAGPEGLTVRKLRAQVRTKAGSRQQLIDDAAELAESIGCITITDGARGARIHRYIRDLTDADIERATT